MSHRVATAIALGLAAASLAVLPAATTAAPAPAAAAAAAKVTNGCLKSRPERGTEEKVKICWTLFKPAGADSRHRVPLMMHSHGWGGSRTTTVDATFTKWLDAGYGILSFDQRGFGESGGFAHVENPRFEGRDNIKLVRKVAGLRWVQQDRPGDPRLGAMGGSYGGGFQFLAAFEELRRTGRPVYDALAPQITWHDLSESLGPQDVPRTKWATLLGFAATQSQALEPKIFEALAEGAATGRWPDGTGPSGVDMNRYFKRNGPRWHVAQGRRLRIPVLIGQGATDTLFSLQEGLDNWQHALTKRSRRHSIFVGYNGGHVIPGAPAGSVPAGNSPAGDPCSEQLAGGTFTDLTIAFMDEQLKGEDRGLGGYGDLHLATLDNTCTTVSSVAPNTEIEVGTVATPGAVGPPIAHPVAEGPIRIAGSSHLTGSLTTVGAGNRAFYGLAVGTSPADARLVQNGVYPLDLGEAVSGEPWRLDLPAVAVDVPEGQTLYVVASAVSDIFGGAQGRTPSVVLLEDTVAHLPVVAD